MQVVLATLLLAPLVFASRLIANSQHTRSLLSARIPSLEKKTSVIYNGIDFAASEASGKVTEYELVLVGRISERKGQDIAVRALRMLRDKGYNFRLAMVGSCHADSAQFEEKLISLIDELQLTSSAFLLGFDADPLKYLHKQVIALIPSRIEPFGNVAIEAMSQGAAVVASRVGGLQEIVRDGVDGLLFDSDNVIDLATKIEYAANHQEEVHEMRCEASRASTERFGPQRYQRELIELLGDARSK